MMISEVQKQQACEHKLIVAFLKNELDDEERLDFLFHLDECPYCWEEVYNASKAEHPHFYKKPSRKSRISEKELRKLESTDREKSADLKELP